MKNAKRYHFGIPLRLLTMLRVVKEQKFSSKSHQGFVSWEQIREHLFDVL